MQNKKQGMQKQSLTIEFFCVEHYGKLEKASILFKYKALVTLISVTFQLFKISDIMKMNSDKIIHLSDCCYITSYPSSGSNKPDWKDASTFQSDKFICAVGEAIEGKEKEMSLV